MKVKNNNERQYGLDILRILAVILVLTVHFFLNTNYYNTQFKGISMTWQSVIRNFCMSCVPLFLMLTGFLNNKTEYNKKFFKGLLTIIIIWLFYSIIEFSVLGIINKEQNNFDFINALFNITSFKACKYSWYIEMYIGLYLIAPIINNSYNSFNQKNRKILVLLAILIGIIPGFINTLFQNIFHLPSYWSSIYPLTYYIIGKYISDLKPNLNKKYLFILLIFMQLFTYSFQTISNINYNSINIFIQTIIIFLLLYNINVKNNFIKKVLQYISSISLDIYLASSLIDQIIYPLFNKYCSFNIIGQSRIIIYAPIILIIIFLISALYGSIRKLLISIR
ncbi:MAG: acyltransferase family protein [Bacilli bacterium]